MAKANRQFITSGPVRLPRKHRKRIETALEQAFDAADVLIATFNRAAADDGLEDNGDLEPSLGSCPGAYGDEDHELDESDSEPSLGWTVEINQERATKPAPGWTVEDGEAEHDGREPSLGAPEVTYEVHNSVFCSTVRIDQTNWAAGTSDDHEGDEHDGRGPDVDDEPSLAALETDDEHPWQLGWGGHGGDDLLDLEQDAGEQAEEVSEDEGEQVD